MSPLPVCAPTPLRSNAGRFNWPQIFADLKFQFFLYALLLISGGMLKASDPGQIVWKEQRGMMRSAEIGVVVWKEQPFHSDESAKAFAFDRVWNAGPIIWFFNGARRQGFEKHELFDEIRFPQWPPGEIATEEDCKSLELKLGELEGFAKKYPNAAGFLDDVISSMRDYVSKFSSGKVFFSGNWITRGEYEKLADQRNEMLQKYKLEREELERRLLKENEKERKLRMAANVQRWSTLILGAGGVWLLLLVLTLLTKSWGSVSFLVVSLAAVAGWFTYTESGFGWIEYVVLALKDLPSLLSFSKE